MHEAYLEQGLIVKDAKKLRIHYVKNRLSLINLSAKNRQAI